MLLERWLLGFRQTVWNARLRLKFDVWLSPPDSYLSFLDNSVDFDY
jgi:hypothetical protein